MKTNRSYLALVLLSLILSSCSDGLLTKAKERVTSRDVDITNYSSVEVSNDFIAYITFSDTEESIKIEANDNLHDYIIATKKNNELLICLKNNLKIKGKRTLNVYITTKSIKSFTAVDDSQIYLENTLAEDYVKIKVTSDSFFTGRVDADYLELTAAADAHVDLLGSVNTLNANLSADTKLSGYDLKIEDLKMKMSSDCQASVTITKTIDIDAIANCTLRYKGNATIIHKNLKADSKVIKIK